MLSVVILTKNEENMIAACINSIKEIADEIIIIDNGSYDHTVELALQKGAVVKISNSDSFAQRRDLGLQAAKGDWILYVDADERVTPDLAKEINEIINTTPDQSKYSGYVINRKDFYFGAPRPLFSPMHRLFYKSNLLRWQGELHETPVFNGLTGFLKNYFLHFTHIDINSMLENTIKWSDQEAFLRLKSCHPAIVWWRLIRVIFTGFWNSYINQQGYKCGTAGWVEAIYQAFSIFITYAKLWEMQNSESINKAYSELDKPYNDRSN